MRAREMEHLLHTLSGYSLGEIDQRMRPLRENNLIPHGPRGPHAPQIEPLHAALMVLSVASRRPSDAGPVALRAMDLQVVPRPGTALDPLSDDTRLAVALATGLMLGTKFLRRVEIDSNGLVAWLTIAASEEHSERRLIFAEAERANEILSGCGESGDIYDRQAGTIGHWVVLGEAAISQISLEMSEPRQGGWGYSDLVAVEK